METIYFPQLLNSGLNITIDDENEFRHAVRSLRKKVGDQLLVTNGRGDLYNAEIISINKRDFDLKLLQKIEKDSDYRTTQVFIALALLNQSSKMKLAIEKLTEIGISGFLPFLSERTVFPDKNLKGLDASAISALKQCGGSVLPQIMPLHSLSELLEITGYDHKFFCHFTDHKLDNSNLQGKILVAIGPEGGWSDEEVIAFEEHGFGRLSLNKRVLRAETAALVAAAKFLN